MKIIKISLENKMKMKKALSVISIILLITTYWFISRHSNSAVMSAISAVCFVVSLMLSIYTYKYLPLKSVIIVSAIYALASSNEVFDFFINAKKINYNPISKSLWDLGNVIRLFMFFEIIYLFTEYKLTKIQE
jgi:hypothetical protein